jgi:hypothetical protein
MSLGNGSPSPRRLFFVRRLPANRAALARAGGAPLLARVLARAGAAPAAEGAGAAGAAGAAGGTVAGDAEGDAEVRSLPPPLPPSVLSGHVSSFPPY